MQVDQLNAFFDLPPAIDIAISTTCLSSTPYVESGRQSKEHVSLGPAYQSQGYYAGEHVLFGDPYNASAQGSR